MKSAKKKKTAAALLGVMIVSLTACSGIGGLGVNRGMTQQISGDPIEEGVSVTYRIVDEDPSEEDMDDTINNMSQRMKEYARRREWAVNDDEITFKIEVDLEKYNMGELVYELGRRGELLILDEENYDAWSQGEAFEAALTGAEVEEAHVVTNTSDGKNSYSVDLVFTDEGTEIFSDFTEENIGKTTYFIFDGEKIMSPEVVEPITNGRVMIVGLKSFEEAKQIADFVMAGALPLELEVVDYDFIEAEE